MTEMRTSTFTHVSWADLEQEIEAALGKPVDLVACEEWNNDSSYGPYDPTYAEPDYTERVEKWLAVPMPDPNDPKYVGNAWKYSLDVRDACVQQYPGLYDLLAYLIDAGFIDEGASYYVDVCW